MNKGTKEGKLEEIYLTKKLNKKIDKSLGKSFKLIQKNIMQFMLPL